MRVYVGTIPWVWLATAAAGTVTWNLATERAEDKASVQAPVSAGQEGYVPQSSPSQGVVE